MAKTIQVRVEDGLKESADSLFYSLGLDTSTAIRMFLMASIEAGGVPFAVKHNEDRDSMLFESIEYRKNGGKFLTVEESLAQLREAIEAGKHTMIIF